MRDVAERLRSGPVDERLRESGVWAFESRHGASFSMTTTVHRFPKLLLIREGCGHVIGDWGTLRCETGDCVLVPPGLRHRIEDDPHRAIWLYGLGVATRLFSCVPEMIADLPRGVLSSAQLKAIAVEQRLKRILYLDGRADAASRLACVASSLELFAEITAAVRVRQEPRECRQPRGHDESHDDPSAAMLNAYLCWLSHHFYEPVTLDAAAHACGMSRRLFTSMFKKHVGMTWLEHVHRLRAKHAVELLCHTDRKVSSVAFQCGFDDLTTFYRVLAKVTGKTPTQLRNEAITRH
jgi:AraC-like DNA-binding protein